MAACHGSNRGPLLAAVGIKEGGRTGVTAFILGMGFVVAMFFAPLFSSIPGGACYRVRHHVKLAFQESAARVMWAGGHLKEARSHGDWKHAIPHGTYSP